MDYTPNTKYKHEEKPSEKPVKAKKATPKKPVKKKAE